MRLYRTADGRWAGTQADAGKGFTQVEVPTDKPGLLAWLNANAVRDEFVDLAEVDEDEYVDAEEPRNRPGYTEQSVAFDEAFAQMPLARKLDFAAKAMEAAREAL